MDLQLRDDTTRKSDHNSRTARRWTTQRVNEPAATNRDDGDVNLTALEDLITKPVGATKLVRRGPQDNLPLLLGQDHSDDPTSTESSCHLKRHDTHTAGRTMNQQSPTLLHTTLLTETEVGREVIQDERRTVLESQRLGSANVCSAFATATSANAPLRQIAITR